MQKSISNQVDKFQCRYHYIIFQKLFNRLIYSLQQSIISFFSLIDLDDSVTGDNVERDDDEELISDEDDDEDEEYDKYPDPDYLIGNKKRRNSETSELSKVSAAEEETSVVNGDHALSIITNYDLDPKHEVFGDAGDQTEEISDELMND